MKVLFIGFSDVVHPWYDDFLEAIAGKHAVELYDPHSPMAPQFLNAEVVVDQGGWGTHEMIDAAIASGVKLWQVIGTGLNHLDVKYLLEKRVPLANTPGVFSGIALAEHALFLMLCLAKNLDESRKNIRKGVFYHPMNEELEGKTLGLVGFGGSARELARRAGGMRMRLLAVDAVEIPKVVQDEYHLDFAGSPAHLDKLLRESDFVSIHAPLTSKTHHLINRKSFALMKPSAILINVARGEIVDGAALLEALQSGRIRGAGIDVYTKEPPDLDNPFLHMENVIATPHVAGMTRGTSQRRGNAAAENVFRTADGLPPLYQVTSAE
jgi:D-3-phosphoglycerate dehydrogenase / 2-oxoglutarate reductase